MEKIVIKLKPATKLKISLKSHVGLEETKQNSSKSLGEELLKHGVVVLPVMDNAELAYRQQQFKDELLNFREYKNPTLSNIYVYGGFGALGNPSSFHNPFVRELRLRMMKEARILFAQLEHSAGSHRQLEQLFDRMAIRRKGTSTTGESWHRDVTPNLPQGDDIFGGWINLDLNRIQYFSCVPGTHMDHCSKSGFATIDSSEMDKYQKTKKIIAVPPGHWIIFYQHIVHEVLPRKAEIDSYRVYLGFHLTANGLPLYNYKDIIQKQGVPLLPGGGSAALYAKMNINFHQKQLIAWSPIFKDVCLEIKKNKKTGETYQLVQRFMSSLTDYGFLLYAPYSEDEINILRPTDL